MIPLVLLLILVSGTGYALYRTNSAFDEVNSVSTPPPEISSSILGGEEGVTIDTGPAQEALRQQEEEQQAASDTGDGDGDAPVGPTQPDGQGQSLQSTSEVNQPAGGDDPTSSATDGQAPASTGTEETLASANASGTPEADQAPPSPDVALVGPSTPVDGDDDDDLTILLMGVDAREGESIDIGVRPDSLGILHLDAETGSCRILGIPRDSRVNAPGYGLTKVNHALAVGGIPYEQLVLEQYLDIEIDHYALLDFAGVTQIVDSVGGVTVDNPEAFSTSGSTFAVGEIELNGEEALRYARYRGGPDGDFGRIERQQRVMRALLDEAASVNLVRTVPRMFGVLSDHFRTDLGPTDLIRIANDYRETCTSETLDTTTIPGAVQTLPDAMMNMNLSFVVSDPAEVRDKVRWLFEGGES